MSAPPPLLQRSRSPTDSANPRSSAVGTPLDWPQTKLAADRVRSWGIEQLLAQWRRARGKERDALLWGDEVGFSLTLTLKRLGIVGMKG